MIERKKGNRRKEKEKEKYINKERDRKVERM